MTNPIIGIWVNKLAEKLPEWDLKNKVFLKSIFDRFISAENFQHCAISQDQNSCTSTANPPMTLKLGIRSNHFEVSSMGQGVIRRQMVCRNSHFPPQSINCDVSTQTGSGYYSFHEQNQQERLIGISGLQEWEMGTGPEKTSELPLLDQFLRVKQPRVLEVPTELRTWAYPLIGASVATALYCGYKTYQAIQQLRRTPSTPLEKKTLEQTEKQLAASLKIKRETLLYGTAAAISSLFCIALYSFGLGCPDGSLSTSFGRCIRVIS